MYSFKEAAEMATGLALGESIEPAGENKITSRTTVDEGLTLNVFEKGGVIIDITRFSGAVPINVSIHLTGKQALNLAGEIAMRVPGSHHPMKLTEPKTTCWDLSCPNRNQECPDDGK